MVPAKFIGSVETVDILLKQLSTSDLRNQIASLGGYDVSLMGNVAGEVG